MKSISFAAPISGDKRFLRFSRTQPPPTTGFVRRQSSLKPRYDLELPNTELVSAFTDYPRRELGRSLPARSFPRATEIASSKPDNAIIHRTAALPDEKKRVAASKALKKSANQRFVYPLFFFFRCLFRSLGTLFAEQSIFLQFQTARGKKLIEF